MDGRKKGCEKSMKQELKFNLSFLLKQQRESAQAKFQLFSRVVSPPLKQSNNTA